MRGSLTVVRLVGGAALLELDGDDSLSLAELFEFCLICSMIAFIANCFLGERSGRHVSSHLSRIM